MKNMVFISSVILSLSFAIKAHCQNENIQYIFDSSNSILEKIIFPGKIQIEYDLIANNPYNELGFKDFSIDMNGNKIYYLSGQEVKTAINLFFKEKIFTIDMEPVILTSQYSCFVQGKNYTTIAYTLCAANKNKKIVGYESKVIVFNKNGNKIFSLINLEIDVRDPQLSSDGNILIVSYGGVVAENGDKVFNQGVKIFDVNKNRLLYEIIGDDSEYYYRPIFINDYTVSLESRLYGFDSKMPIYKFIIVDLYKNVSFYKEIEFKKINELMKRENDKIVFKNNKTGQLEEFYYEKDFVKKYF